MSAAGGHNASGLDFRVLRLPVPAKIYLALESPATVFASEWLEARMFARMRDQIRRLRERLAANGALVRLLTYRRRAMACSKNSEKA